MAYLLNLQRHAGNAAVAGIMVGTGGRLSRSPTWAGAFAIQRVPAFGLAAPRATNEFAETAVKWWRKYPGTTLANLAVILLEEASRSLEKIGVPAVELDAASSTSAAVFHAKTWTISVNVQATGYPPNTKIGDLKPEDLADFADTFFHEARHAEQRFLMARLAVGESRGKDATTIADEVKIPEHVAEAAIKAGGGLSSAQKATAGQLSEFFVKDIGYKVWNNGLLAAASELVASLSNPSDEASITAAWTALAPKVDALRKEVPRADGRIESLSKQAKRSAVDEQILRDVRKTRQELEAAFDKATSLAATVAEWPKMKARQPITADVAEQVRTEFNLRWLEFNLAARHVQDAAEEAYEHYPEEADSRAVGDAVSAAALRGAKAARKRAKGRAP